MNRNRIVGLWLISILVFAGTLVAANWQYNRHIERSSSSDSITNKLNQSLKILDGDHQGLSAWQPVRVKGVLASSGPLIRNRPLEGRNGLWVTSTITTQTGNSYPVLIGWIPATTGATTVIEPPTLTSARIEITGILRELENPEFASDLPAGQFLTMDKQTLKTNKNFFIQVLSAKPAPSADQIWFVPVPNISNGPHFFYAIQWIIFGLIALVGTFWLIRSDVKSDVKT